MKKIFSTAIICLLLVSSLAVSAPVPPTKAAGETPVPGYYETSEYLLGKVAVGVILLESNGTTDPSTEDWNSTREAQVISEISSGLSWLANQNPDAHVGFIYEINYGVPTSYEPINHGLLTDESLWIGEAMNYLGFPGTNYYTEMR